MSVLEYLNNKVTAILKPSSLGGIGFFAVKDIKIGESVFEPWWGESGIYSITQDELFTLPIQLQRKGNDYYQNVWDSKKQNCSS